MDPLNLKGIQDLIGFLKILDKNKISYRLDRQRDDTVMVVIRILKKVIEVDFFDDHIEYSWLEGDEDVHDNQQWLYETLDEFVRE